MEFSKYSLILGNNPNMSRLVYTPWLMLIAMSISAAPGLAVQSTPTPQPSPVQKKATPPDKFPPSPLELTTPDPLLPGGLKRPLSEAEKQKLVIALDQLNEQAAAKYQAGDFLPAFDLWNRELRLRRALGFLPEVQALGRVGDFAWRRNLPDQVRVITKRLEAIQLQVQKPLKNQVGLPERSQVLPALGIAYQQVRSPGLALGIYTQMLTEARQRKSPADETNLLNAIAQLHLSWFDYPQAIAAYTELLNAAKAGNDAANLMTNLGQLAYVSEEAKKPVEAAKYQQQLLEFYQQNQQAELIPALKIRLADNLAAAGQLQAAEQQYQEAFQAAQPVFQLAYATDALKKLGALYRKSDRLDAAVQVYEYLAGVEQQAYDVYAVMDAYDQLGQIHLARKALPQALDAFQRGLEASKQLNHRSEYFTQQIQKIAQQTPR
jgi:tetratricopeptide (TPR) repeat protein